MESFELEPGEAGFDLVFAMRVGALDGRHPELEQEAFARLKAALRPDGLVCIDDRPPIPATAIAAFS